MQRSPAVHHVSGRNQELSHQLYSLFNVFLRRDNLTVYLWVHTIKKLWQGLCEPNCYSCISSLQEHIRNPTIATIQSIFKRRNPTVVLTVLVLLALPTHMELEHLDISFMLSNCYLVDIQNYFLVQIFCCNVKTSFCCKLWDKSFSHPSSLRAHSRIHAGKKPFKRLIVLSVLVSHTISVNI